MNGSNDNINESKTNDNDNSYDSGDDGYILRSRIVKRYQNALQHVETESVDGDDGTDDEAENDNNDDIDMNIRSKSKKNKEKEWRAWLTRCFGYGWYYIVRPCGFILYEAPLYKSEGLTRTIQIWNEAFEGVDSDERPCYAFADRACAIRYNILKSSDRQLQNDWKSTVFVVNRSHGGLSHKESSAAVNQFCQEECDVYKISLRLHKQGRGHEMDTKFPGLYYNGGIPIGNGEVAEQSMNRLGNYANVLRSMRWDNQEYAVFWISVNRNEEYVRSHPHRNPQPCADPFF